MKILSAKSIKDWDQYTINNEPITSLNLMERAAQSCVDWILAQPFKPSTFKIFCGKGNNGGDGLAIARMLASKGFGVKAYILQTNNKCSEDFEANLNKLKNLPVELNYLVTQNDLPVFEINDIIIDALFGSGLNKPLDGIAASTVQHINASGKKVIAIDIPSGMFMDASSKENVIVKADDTLTFQVIKLAFLVAENAPYFGNVHILDIGLHPHFLENEKAHIFLTDEALIKSIFKKRKQFHHKGNFGHCLVVGGSYGKMGAALLTAKACLKSGSGLVTVYIPKFGYNILQTAVPEAMVLTDDEINLITALPDTENFTVVGVGPGLGTDIRTQNALVQFFKKDQKPVVIDADGLNCIALKCEVFIHLPPYAVLTPHPKEFDRLFGEHTNEFERFETARQRAQELKVVIVLKGHHTLIATPGGELYFNNTGNAGMATGGSGDVLTGIITSFLGQGYEPLPAAILGVYIHGLAGDLAARQLSQESMIASDIINYLSQAFLHLNND